MKRGVVTILFVICIIFVISFVSSAAIDEELHLNIQVIDSAGDVETGTFDFEFNISTLADCSDVVYTNFTTLTTDSRGIISYYLENVNLNFSSQYWLCYYRDDVLINASKIARTPYSFTAKNVSAEGIINDSNMNLVGYNVTASSGLFSWLGSLVSRITKLFVQDIDFTGNINGSGNITTTGNVTADYFLGDGSKLAGVEGFYNSSSWNRSGTDVILHHIGDSVGIGTSNPTHTLNVDGTMNVTGASVMGDVDFNDGWLNGGVSISGGDLYAQTVWVYNLSSLSVNSLSINGSILPPVGFDDTFDIGNSSLRWKDIYISGNLHSNGTAGDNYFLGDVGIGTGSPSHKLQVIGNISSENFNATGDKTYVGTLAGYNNTGDYVTATGYSAGYNNSVDRLTATGYKAGYSNTGGHVTAIGFYAGYLNRGTLLTAIGAYAGYLNNGSNVDVMGHHAGSENMGDYVTAIGYYAGKENNGSNSNFMGYLTGQKNIGNYSTCIGDQACVFNTGEYLTAMGSAAAYNKGSYVSAIGYAAADRNNGSYSNFMGYYAGSRNIGNYSIGIGYEALMNNDGNWVVALGYEAGEENTGTQVVALGYEAATRSTGDYVNAIGYEAGEDNVGNHLVAIGYGAGDDNIGNESSLIGRVAGKSNVANYVVGVGYSVLYRNTGAYATAMGYKAGYDNVGNWSIMMGHEAGYENEGNYLTATGVSAAKNNIGIYTSSFGYGSGYQNNGSYLSSLGYYAGRDNTGSELIAIGSWAGEDNTGDDVIAIGYQAADPNSGRNLVAIGDLAGALNVGNYSIGIGFKAAYNNDGNNVIAMGYEALMNNIGKNVVAMGYSAGEDNIGNYSIALGYYSGYENREDYLSVMGYWAGRENIGKRLAAIGFKAGYQNKGNYSIAIGNVAGYKNRGNYLSAIGSQAGYENRGDYLNVIGDYAGNKNNGSYVNLMGYWAGSKNIGNYSVGIGYEALKDNRGSNVIAIGYEAGEGNTAKDQFILKQDNVNAVPLIQGNFSSGHVGIGTITPGAKLEILGADNADLLKFNTATLGNMILTSNGIRRFDFETSSINNYLTGFTNTGTGEHNVYFEDNVGIGTSTPGAELDVVGNVNISGNTTMGDGATFLDIYYDSAVVFNLSDNLVITGGNVGIGTIVSPTGNLEVNGPVDPVNITMGFGSNKNAAIISEANLYFAIDGDNDNTGRTFSFWNNGVGVGTPLLLMEEGGNVGIGTASPEKKLHVNGTTGLKVEVTGSATAINAAGYYGIYSSSTHTGGYFVAPFYGVKGLTTTGTGGYFHASDGGTAITTGVGNVGIGTTSPLSQLSLQKSGESLGQTIMETAYFNTCGAVAITLYTFPIRSTGIVYVNSVDASDSSSSRYSAMAHWSTDNAGTTTYIVEKIYGANAATSNSGANLQIVCTGTGLNEIAITVIGNRRS